MKLRLVAGIALLVGTAARADALPPEFEGAMFSYPIPQGESLSVDNRMGAVRLRASDEPVVKILAAKRAATTQVLERLKVKVDIAGGKVHVTTGVLSQDGTLRSVPLADARIDLDVTAPRTMTISATTFNGAIDASGFRTGATLESQHGEIRAADLGGRVDTRTLAGRQSLQGIHGPLDASGIEGDVELVSVDGPTADATVYKGQITAREVTAPVVRLRTTGGEIIFVGEVVQGGRYELSSLEGQVRMVLRLRPLHLVAKAPPGKIDLGIKLDAVKSAGDGIEGDYQGGGASLELVAPQGGIKVVPASDSRLPAPASQKQ